MKIGIIFKRWYWKNYFFRLKNNFISSVIGYDAVLVGSEIRMLKASINCLNSRHDWQDWSATLCRDIAGMTAIRQNRYLYRACKHCGAEMPKSRIYPELKVKEENALEFKK